MTDSEWIQFKKDWKGNDILPGHEICLIKIKRPSISYGFIIPDSGEEITEELPEEECWEVGEYYLVDENYNISGTNGG